MKVIILIEDRITRQAIFLKKFGKNPAELENEFENLKNIAGGQEFDDFKNKIESQDWSALDEYKVLILHRSAFAQSSRQSIIQYCKERKKRLVFFSGGISASVYSESIGFPFLTLNSQDFYSNNLVTFLNHAKQGDYNLLILSFGERWELNILMNLNLKIVKLLNHENLGAKISKEEVIQKISLEGLAKQTLKKNNIEIDWLDNDLINDPKKKLLGLQKDLKTLINNKIFSV